jgi:hypothetical protein
MWGDCSDIQVLVAISGNEGFGRIALARIDNGYFGYCSEVVADYEPERRRRIRINRGFQLRKHASAEADAAEDV